MKLYLMLICIILISATCIFAETVATVYSDYGNYIYKKSNISEITALNYEHKGYENTELSSLMNSLSDYKAVIFNPVFNFTNTQDFTLYKNQISNYLQNGGIMIVTDTNYPQNFTWLASLSPDLEFVSGKEQPGQEQEESVLINHHHPMLFNVASLNLPWCSTEKVGKGWTVLAKDKKGHPSTVYAKIGKGLLIVSTSYVQQGFPSAQFLKNVFAFANTENNFTNEIKHIKTAKKWSVPYTLHNTDNKADNKIRTEWTVKYDDYGFYFRVVCSDPDLINTTTKATKRNDTVYNDDCAEIYLSPSDSENYYYFAISNNNIVCDAINSDVSYDTYISSKVSQNNDSWTADVYIPFSSIGITEKTKTFACNIVRVYHPSKPEYSLFSSNNITRENLTDREKWSVLDFSEPVNTKKYNGTKNFDVTLPESIPINSQTDIIFPENGFYGIKCLDTGKTVNINGKSGKYTFNQSGDCEFQFLKYDKKNGGVIASSPIKKVSVKDILKYKIIYPYYRSIVQSKDPDKTMRALCSCEQPGTVLLSVIQNGKTVKTAKKSLAKNSETELSCDLSELKEGNYTYTLTLKDSKNRELQTVRKSFRVLAPADFEVTFDRKRVCYLNGEPFFPIGLYHVGHVAMGWLNEKKKTEMPALNLEEINRDVAEHGFNLAMSQSNIYLSTSEDANLAQKYGMIFNYESGPVLDKKFLAELVKKNNENLTGLFYYTVDEPINEKLISAIGMYNILSELDPHRPCGAAVCFPGVFKGAVKAFDIMMPDTYLYKGKTNKPSLSGLLDPINKAMEACGGQKPLWAVPQAFGWGGELPGFCIPAQDDLRCQMYFYLVYGATGFCWYGYTSPEDDDTAPYGAWHLPSSDLWDYFKVLNKEMQEFAPVIFYGESVGPLNGNNEKIHSNVWTRDGKNYAIIVNPEREELSVSYPIGSKITPYFKDYNYNITQDGTNSVFTLAPLECVIIQY